MERHDDDVYCDLHGCIHAKSKWPFDNASHKNEKGEWVYMVYVDLDAKGKVVDERDYDRVSRIVATVPREAEPDCLPINWRKLWVGAPIEG